VITISSISGLLKISQKYAPDPTCISVLLARIPDVLWLASSFCSRSHFAYNSSKGATIHLNRMMSQEWAHTGIRFNTIAPGMFPSEMTTTGSDEKQKSSLKGFNPKSMLIPAERAGEDEDLGGTILYLSSRAGQ
jgi:NAD(P)-dependent dehydrogenase (short-subunit alcohol dehydrogenase family)